MRVKRKNKKIKIKININVEVERRNEIIIREKDVIKSIEFFS